HDPAVGRILMPRSFPKRTSSLTRREFNLVGIPGGEQGRRQTRRCGLNTLDELELDGPNIRSIRSIFSPVSDCQWTLPTDSSLLQSDGSAVPFPDMGSIRSRY